MSKFDEMNSGDELTEEMLDELALEVVGKGPAMGMTPMLGNAKKMVEQYSHCDLCGGHLHFVHSTDFSRNTTNEKASCPECGLDARHVLHRLQ